MEKLVLAVSFYSELHRTYRDRKDHLWEQIVRTQSAAGERRALITLRVVSLLLAV